ncbi:hypothetical protein JCM11641_003890 [Rhodosporidiobolus odoratus]
MAHAHRQPRDHRPSRLTRRACSSTSALYTYPASTDTLPVYEPISLTWDPTCVEIKGSTIDLYLSVQEDSGWLAVREWTGATYSAGKLDTQLQPGWWNASTGAGSVSAQLSIVPSGEPSWNTPAPSGPIFTISYNGSYPTVTDSAAASAYTGPSVESVENKSTSTPSGGKLGAAVAVPLLALAVAALGYVIWNKRKKKSATKRFSAVVDNRMSMISQGTWQPRPSMAASRPGSFHPTHRPSGSQYSVANRQSYFADPSHRNSTYSFAGSGMNGPSPLGAGIRPPAPAEMRQTGQGDRVSRVSFAAGEGLPRPSMASSRHGAGNRSSVHTRSSLHHSRRNSTFFASEDEPLPTSPGLGSSHSSSQHSPVLARSTSSLPRSPSAADNVGDSYFPRSFSTREELASIRSPSSTSLKPSPLGTSSGHAPKASVASSLRNELSTLPALAVVRDGDLAYGSSSPSPKSPFGDPIPSQTPPLSSIGSATRSKPTLPALSTDSLPAMTPAYAHRSSQILSPDQALASYARDAVSPPPGARGAASRTNSSGGGGGIAGMLLSRPAKMLRNLTGGSLAAKTAAAGAGNSAGSPEMKQENKLVEEEEEDNGTRQERAKSPFEDPEDHKDRDDGTGFAM